MFSFTVQGCYLTGKSEKEYRIHYLDRKSGEARRKWITVIAVSEKKALENAKDKLNEEVISGNIEGYEIVSVEII